MAVCGPGTRGLLDTLGERYWRPLDDRHAAEGIGVRRRLRHLRDEDGKDRYVRQDRRCPIEQERQPRANETDAECRHHVRHHRQRIDHLVDVGHVVLLRVVEPVEAAQRSGNRRVADQLGNDFTGLVIGVAHLGCREGHRGDQIILLLLEGDPLFLLLLGDTDDLDPRPGGEGSAYAVAVEHVEAGLLLLDPVRARLRA